MCQLSPRNTSSVTVLLNFRSSGWPATFLLGERAAESLSPCTSGSMPYTILEIVPSSPLTGIALLFFIAAISFLAYCSTMSFQTMCLSERSEKRRKPCTQSDQPKLSRLAQPLLYNSTYLRVVDQAIFNGSPKELMLWLDRSLPDLHILLVGLRCSIQFRARHVLLQYPRGAPAGQIPDAKSELPHLLTCDSE